MKKIIRTLQTFFPYLHDLRYSFRFWKIKITKTPHENDFNAIRLFKPNSEQVFLDIGSNRGDSITSMLIFSKFNNKIIGFEPNPLIFSKLKNYLKRNNRVLVHNCGLGNNDEELKLFVPFYRKYMFDGLSSFIYEAANDWLKTRIWHFNEKKLSVRELNCQIRKLDDFELNPYFIKIDVQGYELEVLKGGFLTINTHKPIILLESITSSIMDFLEQYNYQFYSYKNGELTKGKGKLNTFCMTQEKFAELS